MKRDRAPPCPRIESVSARFVSVGMVCLAALPLSLLFLEASADAGDPWARLRRPLHLPSVTPGHRCPRTHSVRRVPGIAAALGRGPAYPTVGSRVGIAYIGPRSDAARIGSWYFRKTI